MDLKGNLMVIPISQIRYFYRGTDLNNELIFLSATLKGSKSTKKEILVKINNLLEKKKTSQPFNIKTCGSTFKNPQNNSEGKAWQLIKKSECDKLEFGDAQLSKKHCNFIINKKSATSSDLEKLINTIRKRVFNKTKIKLELELKIIGEKK